MTKLATIQRIQKQCRAQQGSALLVVLLLLGTMAALAAVVSRSVAGAALEMRAAQLSVRHEWDLRSGIELGVATILKLGEGMRSAEASVRLPDRRIDVRVTNERARIDINTASPALLLAMLKAGGVVESDAVVLVQGIVEWRGGSASQKLAAPIGDDRQFSGFAGSGGIEPRPETELREAPKQNVGTRFFLHPTQLASVPGFSEALVSRVLALITVANGTNQVDPYIASRGVLLSLPGTSPASVDAFLSTRHGNSGRDAAVKSLGVAETLVTLSVAAGWRIEIASVAHNGRPFRSEAVVATIEGDTEAYRVLYVLDAR
jgi:hypothetical protein